MIRSSRLLVLLPLAVAASGCAMIGGSPPERYGGSATLTAAASEAAKDSADKHRRLDVGDRVPTYPDWSESQVGAGLTSEEPGATSSSPGSNADPTHWVLGAVGGGGSLGGQEFEGFGFGGLDIGAFVTPRWRFDIGLLVLSPNLTEASVAGQGLKNETELAADLSVRFYLTPPHTFLGIYPLGGFRFGTLFWSYQNPVQVIADGYPKTVEDDYLNYFGLYGGLGISLVQARHFSTGMNLTGGFRTYEESTFEGFHNTLFPTTGYTQLAFEVVYRF